MKNYHKPLYVSYRASIEEAEALKQALSLARNNEAPLKVLIVSPKLPKEFPEYQQKYEASLLEQAEKSIELAKEEIKLDKGAVDISVQVIFEKRPTNAVIQYILEHSHDILIKESEKNDNQAGFKAMDMDLLHKCPVPVWLCNPIIHPREHIQVAVAIAPEKEEAEEKALSLRILEIGRSLADSCSGELHIISCWDYAFESSLRHNLWFKTTEDEIKKIVFDAQADYRIALESLIESSGISGKNHITFLRGKPDDKIPDFVNEKQIDILIMGTVARTGIPAFFIGNTAENIIQKLTCSLLALKPPGFISPVKLG